MSKRFELIGKNRINLYVKGGKGTLKLQAPSGNYHIYSFREPMDKDNFDEWVLFAFCKHEDGRWLYVGKLDKDLNFKYTRNSKYGVDSEEFKGAAYIVKLMKQDVNTPMKLFHYGRCSVCGKKLTNDFAIKNGMGYRCRRKLIKELELSGVK